MVDMFALAVSHGLLAIAVWRLLSRDDLSDDKAADRRGRGGRQSALRQPGLRRGKAPDA